MSQPVDARASYCYRHPDRESYVLCQRCGRTICGECQTPGAVGVICPECMAEQRATAPKTKPAWVPRLTGSGAPVVTYAIIAVCAVVFVLQSLPVIGASVTQAIQYAGVYSDPRAFEPWRLLTSVFAHGGIIHILLNMYTLWIFGSIMEPMLGRLRFLALFLISGFAGSVGVLLLGNPLQPVVGASGAIFGLFGAYFIIQRRLGGNATQMLVLITLNIGIGFLPGLNIAWQAHVGGLVGGILVGLIFVETRKPSRRALQLPLVIVLSLLLIALSLIRFL